MSGHPAPDIRRILVVDDNAAIHEDFRKILRPDRASQDLDELETDLFGSAAPAAGAPCFDLDFASQGAEALELVRHAATTQQPYQAAFVDVRMPPGWDGVETIGHLWEADPRIEVVLCTAYSDYSWKDIVDRLGYTDRLLLLKKPFDGAEVRQLALALVAKWQLKRAAEEQHEQLERMVTARTAELEQRNRELGEAAHRQTTTAEALAASNEVRGEQARVLTLLLDLSSALATADDVPTAVAQTIRVAAALTTSRRVSVMLPNEEQDYLTIAAALGMEPELTRQVRVPVGGAIAGQVFRTGQPVVLNSPEEVGRGRQQYDSSFFVSAPLASRALITSEKVVGVLNITERVDGRPFTPGELQSIDMICNMAASAINNITTRHARDEARDSVVRALATLVEYRDSATGQHLERVTGFSLLLAEALRRRPEYAAIIDDAFLQDLRRAVPLHDVGKVAVPDHLLSKHGKLTHEEQWLMRRHAEIGAEAICAMMSQAPGAQFLTMAAEIAHGHHERYDGGGYPCGLSGDGIPLSAQITALADVYDALTSRRTYKNAYDHAIAADLIRRGRGTQFAPQLVEAFLSREEDFARLSAQLADDAAPPGDADPATEPATSFISE